MKVATYIALIVLLASPWVSYVNGAALGRTSTRDFITTFPYEVDGHVTDSGFLENLEALNETYYEEMFEAEAPTCINGYKTLIEGDDYDGYGVNRPGENEIFVGGFDAWKPFRCHAMCYALKQVVYPDINALNLYLTRWLGREESLCYCMRNAHHVQKVLRKGRSRDLVFEPVQYRGRLYPITYRTWEGNVYSCGVQNVTGTADTNEDVNWIGFPGVPDIVEHEFYFPPTCGPSPVEDRNATSVEN